MATQQESALFNYNTYSQLELVMLFFLGAVVLGVHVGLYVYSPHLFTILISLYIIVYAIFVIICVDKVKTAMAPRTFSLISYFSFYTVFLQTFLILFAIAAWLIRRRTTFSSY